MGSFEGKNQLIKRITVAAELRREWRWQGETQTKRVPVETERSGCLFSPDTLFLHSLRY